MKQIINNRPSILVLPQSKLVLKPNQTIGIETLTDELQEAVSRSWVNLVEKETPTTTVPAHDWVIDDQQAKEGVVSITDKATGKQINGEIVEEKGKQYFTLKEIGTVKGSQYWPTTQALEYFDAVD